MQDSRQSFLKVKKKLYRWAASVLPVEQDSCDQGEPNERTIARDVLKHEGPGLDRDVRFELRLLRVRGVSDLGHFYWVRQRHGIVAQASEIGD